MAERWVVVLLGAGDDDLAVRRKLGGKPGHLVAVLRSNLSEKDNCTLSNRIVSLSHERQLMAELSVRPFLLERVVLFGLSTLTMYF